MREVPVVVRLSGETVSIRGSTSDVDYVVASLNEHLYGFYESRMVLDTSLFSKVVDSCKKSSVLEKIKTISGAFLAVSVEESALIFRGKRDQVKAAKHELLGLFDFLLQPGFGRLPLPGPVGDIVGTATSMAEISAVSGTSVVYDRDTNCALVFSADPDKMAIAIATIRKRIDVAESTFFVIQLDEREAWLMPLLIGAKGAGINALRKQTKCLISADGTYHRLTVRCKAGGATLKAARSILEVAIDEARKKHSQVRPGQHKPRTKAGRETDGEMPATVVEQPLLVETCFTASLHHTPCRSVGTSATAESTPGRSWAAVVEYPEDDPPPPEEIEAPPELIRTH
jgi:hypothetical protein